MLLQRRVIEEKKILHALKLCWIMTHIKHGLNEFHVHWKANIVAHMLTPNLFEPKNKTMCKKSSRFQSFYLCKKTQS